MQEYNGKDRGLIALEKNVNENQDEIDMSAVFQFLWLKRKFILLFTLLGAIVATINAVNKPNQYRVETFFKINSSFYAVPEINEPDVSKYLTLNNLQIEFPDLLDMKGIGKGGEFKYTIDGGQLKIEIISLNLDDAYDLAMTIVGEINEKFKKSELESVVLALNSITPLLNVTKSEEANEYVSKTYAQQIYKKTVLESPSSKLIYLASLPIKGNSLYKPNRPEEIKLGVFLGLIMGLIFVFAQGFYKKIKP